MRPLILPLLLSLMACGPTEFVYLPPDIPPDLLTPCPISQRQVATTRELAALATEHLDTARCANGKITAIAEIVGPQ